MSFNNSINRFINNSFVFNNQPLNTPPGINFTSQNTPIFNYQPQEFNLINLNDNFNGHSLSSNIFLTTWNNSSITNNSTPLFGNFSMPKFNWNFKFTGNSFINTKFNFIQTPFTTKKTSPTTSNPQTTEKLSSISTPTPKYLSSTKNIQWWIDRGYNPSKGKKLCEATKRHLDANIVGVKSNGRYKYRETAQCVGYVRKGINDAFYGGKTHYSQFGKAYLCGETYLSKDKNFRKLTGVDMAQINPANIPEGAVVIYNPGYSNSKFSYCGHGEVSNGNGKGYSDVLTNLKNSGKQAIREIWIPV